MTSVTANEQFIPFLDLKAQYTALSSEINAAVLAVLSAQNFILGPNVERLEQEVAAYCGVAHAVGVASGTDALILALKVAGVTAGDEVIVPAFTFIATADAVSLLGAVPVFADIDAETTNIDPQSIREKITVRTKAIIPVHLYGQAAQMGEILAIAAENGLKVIEDNAQGLGARFKGVRTGGLGDMGCISFFPSKNLGGCGDGGMVVTNDAEYAAKLRILRSHGSRRKYYSEVQGWNSRLDELQAAILRVKLPYLDSWNVARREAARRYDNLLKEVKGVKVVTVRDNCDAVFHQYTIRIGNRDAVKKHLADKGVQTFIYYPVPLHLQTMFSQLGYVIGDCPQAESAAAEVLSLPIYPELRADQAQYVISALREAVESAN